MLLVLKQEFHYNFDNFLNISLAWQDAWKSLYSADCGCTHGYKFASIWTLPRFLRIKMKQLWYNYCVPKVVRFNDLYLSSMPQWHHIQILSSIPPWAARPQPNKAMVMIARISRLDILLENCTR